MKKILLLAGMAATVVAVQAENSVMPGAAITNLSADGRYAVSAFYESMTIYDLTTGESWDYQPDDMGTVAYSPGLGNAISKTGIVLGSTLSNTNAAYWQNGDWHNLPVANPDYINMANGVTPDGTVICGSVGMAEFSTESGTMLYPAVWTLQADGTYSDPVVLPHPEKDFTGRAPQYITAVSVSDDGKTVIGQMTDYTGYIQEPLVYTLTDEGWTCTNLFEKLFAVEGFVFPDDPGESPKAPDANEYMTEDELAAYNEAYAAWQQNCMETGVWDYSLMPSREDFMSEEEKAAFQAAQEEYNVAYNEWYDKFLAFSEAYYEYLDQVPSFVFNNVLISADGSKYITTQQIEWFNPETWESGTINHPVVLNTNAEDYLVYDADVAVSQYLPDGTILGTFSSQTDPGTAYIKPADSDEFVTLLDYMNSTNPATGAWMKEVMTHSVEVYDPATGEIVNDDMMISGIPCASADLSTIATFAQNIWDDTDAVYSYLMTGVTTGITDAAVEASKLEVKVAGSSIVLNADNAKSLKVYTLEGRCVVNVNAPASVTTTSLAAGVYIVEAVSADGVTTVVKARVK